MDRIRPAKTGGGDGVSVWRNPEQTTIRAGSDFAAAPMARRTEED
jgi:hypothetical protein